MTVEETPVAVKKVSVTRPDETAFNKVCLLQHCYIPRLISILKTVADLQDKISDAKTKLVYSSLLELN